MSFNEILNEYIQMLNCTAAELAASSGLSNTVISRYRNGRRVPVSDSEQIADLAEGIVRIAVARGIPDLSKEQILYSLRGACPDPDFNYEKFAENLSALLRVLSINQSEVARFLNFDASYLSRILSGKRQPANPADFVHSIAGLVVRKYTSKEWRSITAQLMNCSPQEIEDDHSYQDRLEAWLSLGQARKDSVNHFLEALDKFDLSEYISAIHFNELKVPSVPFQLPASRNYYGIEQMRKGELDFFRATVMAKSKEPLFMCSDMPMEDMAEDMDFNRKWMFGIAMCLKKGLHLNMIHNLERPFNELMLGLESWIPIYMTGQISPYYLTSAASNIYRQLNYVSGNTALFGECVSDYHDKGRYYLTNNREEVDYFAQKADSLLHKARPLMDIYTVEKQRLYSAFLQSDAAGTDPMRRILVAPPIHTLSDKLLDEMLKNAGTADDQAAIIRQYHDHVRLNTASVVEHSSLEDLIPLLPRETFDLHPLCLSLAEIFYENEIVYTYDQYQAHWQLTKEYAEKNPHYHVKENPYQTFRNINIVIRKGKWSMLSKSKAPAIHFVIHHAKLRDAIENFSPPVAE